MKENLLNWKEKARTFWQDRSKMQKGTIFASVAIVILFIIVISLVSANPRFVPLYNNLSLTEVGQIKAELEARSVSYELTNGGTSISVPEENVDALLVDLASAGLPNSGNIDYSFFSENTSWGITDNEFSIMKLDAMQTEMANLIKSIEGIDNAQVMISMPEEAVFVSENNGEASASVVIHTKAGYQIEANQINTLYHLIAKAVPNLPEDNIVIMNQHFEYFDRNAQSGAAQDTYTHQQTVKKEVEKDIQRRLQQMLGTMVGNDNVIVSVTADIDFTQENRLEELVEPVDIENVRGIPVSLEEIQESYIGSGAQGGIGGTGEEDVANYPAANGNDDGEYELDKETINYEFNRIRKEIVESPYKVRDLGIQVAVNNLKNTDGDASVVLTPQEQSSVEEGIESILSSVIGTTIDSNTDIQANENISIVFQEFSGSTNTPQQGGEPSIPLWMYIVGSVLILLIIILAILLFRNRETAEEVEEFIEEEPVVTEVPDLPQDRDSESVIRRKQLEKIAKEKPEEFAKLLRSWIGED